MIAKYDSWSFDTYLGRLPELRQTKQVLKSIFLSNSGLATPNFHQITPTPSGVS